MSSNDHPVREREEYPSFELTFQFDSTDAPREVTVYEPDPTDAATAWITADLSTAVPIEDVR